MGQDRNIDYYVKEKLEKIEDLIAQCKSGDNTEEELNRELWRILGSGYELHLMMQVPLRDLPLLMNDLKDSPIEDLLKIRLTIGK